MGIVKMKFDNAINSVKKSYEYARNICIEELMNKLVQIREEYGLNTMDPSYWRVELARDGLGEIVEELYRIEFELFKAVQKSKPIAVNGFKVTYVYLKKLRHITIENDFVCVIVPTIDSDDYVTKTFREKFPVIPNPEDTIDPELLKMYDMNHNCMFDGDYE